MSPQTGRPKIDSPKSEQITVRLDNKKVAIIKEYCEQEQVERGEAIRRRIDKLKSDKKIKEAAPKSAK